MFSLQKIIVSFCFVFLSVEGFAGDPFRFAAGAREAGMGYAFVMTNDLWSSFHNQAALAFNKTCSFGFNYNNRFNISELSTRSAGINIPAGRVSLGAQYSHFGYSDFSRQSIGVACGMPLSDIIAGGVQIGWYYERSEGEYNSNQTIVPEAGIIVTASENVKIGVHVFNPVPNSLRKSDIPTRLRTGACVSLSREFSAGVETEMSTGDNPILRTGFEYAAAKKLLVRGGFSTESSSFSFGVGYRAGPATIDFAFSTHERLGLTSSVSVVFEMKSINRKLR